MMRSLPRISLRTFLLTLFALSTPISALAVFYFDGDRHVWAILNAYAFSFAMNALYLAPLVLPTKKTLDERLDLATEEWVIVLSCFTEIAFQIPHSLATSTFRLHRGGLLEWPFWSYGLSDDRWVAYEVHEDGAVSLPRYVNMINANDAILGILVLVAYIAWRREKTFASRVLFSLILIFRDATLFRETCEYMYEHHVNGYPYTSQRSDTRHHAIACLWLVNIMWLVAPLLSLRWAYSGILRSQKTKKN